MEAPAVVQATTAPVQAAPAPVQATLALVQAIPAPAQFTPAPVQAPQPVAEAPQAVAEAPQPVQTAAGVPVARVRQIIAQPHANSSFNMVHSGDGSSVSIAISPTAVVKAASAGSGE